MADNYNSVGKTELDCFSSGKLSEGLIPWMADNHNSVGKTKETDVLKKEYFTAYYRIYKLNYVK